MLVCEVGCHQGENAVGQSVQIADRGFKRRADQFFDDNTLAAGADKVVVDFSAAGIPQCLFAGQMVRTGGEGSTGFVIDIIGFRLGKFQVNAAKGIDRSFKGFKINNGIIVDVYLEIQFDGIHQKVNTTPGIGGVQRVPYVTVFHGDADVSGAGEGCQMNFAGIIINSSQNHSIRTADVIAAGVGADQQDVFTAFRLQQAAVRVKLTLNGGDFFF